MIDKYCSFANGCISFYCSRTENQCIMYTLKSIEKITAISCFRKELLLNSFINFPTGEYLHLNQTNT